MSDSNNDIGYQIKGPDVQGDVVTISGQRFEKVQELWFDDADVIFRAESKAFRVHRGILSARSTIFKDMFSIPRELQATSSMNTMIDIVDLPDAQMDVYYFFLAIFDASFYEPPPASPSLDAIVSILRLSNKYDVPFLKQRSLSHLEQLFPLDYESFSIAVDKSMERLNLSYDGIPALVARYLEITELVYIVDARWILPPLFVAISPFSLSVILRNDSWTTLRTQAQIDYLLFRDEYLHAMMGFMSWLSTIPQPTCTDPTHCAGLSKYLSITYYSAVGKRPSYSPSTVVQGQSFCNACQAGGNLSIRQAESDRWHNLPTFLGFSGWEDVKKMKVNRPY